MAELNRAKLHAFFSAKAKTKETTTIKEVAQEFSVSDGAAGKCMSILTGNGVLVDAGDGQFRCERVAALSVVEFESAASQGKDTTYVDGLWRKIDTLNKNNETMRAKLLEAQARLKELEGK